MIVANKSRNTTILDWSIYFGMRWLCSATITFSCFSRSSCNVDRALARHLELFNRCLNINKSLQINLLLIDWTQISIFQRTRFSDVQRISNKPIRLSLYLWKMDSRPKTASFFDDSRNIRQCDLECFDILLKM